VGYGQRMKLAKVNNVGEDKLIIRMDRKTRHLRITAPDNFDLALSMLKGAAIALKEAHDKVEASKPKVVPATEGEARALGIVTTH
jgi:hypothetical protein